MFFVRRNSMANEVVRVQVVVVAASNRPVRQFDVVRFVVVRRGSGCVVATVVVVVGANWRRNDFGFGG